MQVTDNQTLNILIDFHTVFVIVILISIFYSLPLPPPLPPQYENDVITIDLVQNSSQKTQNDVDIADVAYYFEKDVSIILLILSLF